MPSRNSKPGALDAKIQKELQTVQAATDKIATALETIKRKLADVIQYFKPAIGNVAPDPNPTS